MAGPDVRKLALFFETLAASSPPDKRKSSEIINRKGCRGSAGSGTYTVYTPVVFMGQNDFGGPVARGGASVDKRQCVPCNECFNSHPPYSYCPYTPCDICDKVHDSARCPYFDHLPQGATFPPGYEIVCRCGNLFNEDKWACSSCGGSIPVLKAKYCSICNVYYQHGVYECPVDKEHAAKYKSVRDEMLSRVPIPHRPVYPESSSGIPYVPTTPSSSVCGDMKEGKDMNIGTPCWKPVSWTL
uniref:uncharacterized protein LOC101294899 isoform X2 n=1 Tax=Fragaria vesca subsp. vesca TaxID=101020 RepID=UPI0005C80524|nr:PREDICTED: uncharacterized protein LOC101294899 isoform X2 [Fragaria vesca subsp. vesca]